ncbi:MAG: hypothetical protein NT117_01080 [Gammaproteobacteria bacterium]|nr:hypothetical protein [Gammaproteobacteria bacterium]
MGAALLVLLSLLAVARSAVGTRLDSFTIDEPWHIVAGSSYVRTGDFRLNPEQPPLVKLWVGTFMPSSFKLPPLPELKEKGNEREFTEIVMYEGNDSLAAQQRARVAMWTGHALLLLAVGLLCWRALGLPWAAGMLAFLAIDPTIGAHLPVVMMDLALGLTLILAALSAGLLFARWQWRWAAALGLAVGLALGSKHSALAGLAGLGLLSVAMALLPAAAGAPGRGRRLLQVVFAGALGLAVLWAQYGFHFHAGTDGSDKFNMPMPEKISGLQVPALRSAIAFADDAHLLPRSYLWGLADTVRAGVEGRGQAEHLVWGRIHNGAPPWHTWPSAVASKLPLALLALCLLGAVTIWRMKLSTTMRTTLLAVLVMAGTHLAALMSSQGTYAGIRHGLPLVFALALLAGGVFGYAWQARSRLVMATSSILLLLALAMTAREPRLWEYFNELGGGTAHSWDQFGNEGVDLGQRFHELNAFYLSTMKPGGLPVYYDYPLIRRQAGDAGLPLQRRVESLQDENVKGIYDGWFVKGMWANMPWPSAGYDPKDALRGLRPVARFGQMQVWRGRQARPESRAHSMFSHVMEHIYKKGGSDWPLVEKRCAEIVALLPWHVGAAIELGNARLRLGDAAGARSAYQGVLDAKQQVVEARTRAQIQAQIARIDSGIPAKQIVSLRNPWLE